MADDALEPLLDELSLLRSSLLSNERITFTPATSDADWESLLENHISGAGTLSSSASRPAEPPTFSVEVSGSTVSLLVTPCRTYPASRRFDVAVRGNGITREEQERWQALVAERQGEMDENTEYPMYELISLYLLPLLQEEAAAAQLAASPHNLPGAQGPTSSDPPYHALFTSHHLISPKKRRALHLWSTELSLSGFAKLGHPGLIYAEGRSRANVEEFVRRVKGIQWLALRLRVAEEIEGLSGVGAWKEVEKVGEVVEEMRKRGRDALVLDLGIGSGAGA